MYMRIVNLNILPEKSGFFHTFYENNIIPELSKIPGCLSARLMQSAQNPEEYISMTFWENPEIAEDYNKGLFQTLFAQARPYLASSEEWQIHLSEDFTLDFEPPEDDPIVKSYPVMAAANQENSEKNGSKLMFMRIVAVKIQPGKLEEFRRLYTEEIIPALRAVKGCRYAYLTDNFKEEHEIFSVTLWNSKEDVENYENSGLFDRLREKTKHTFSELFQWKMALEKESGKKMVTSDDMQINYYSVITGKKFR